MSLNNLEAPVILGILKLDGYCAQIAGMVEEDFIKYLSDNGISIFSFDDENEFIEEMDNA